MTTARGDLEKDTGGLVYVEFLLVFPPLFLFFLIILQAALLRASDLGVTHAASAAARSAVVVLPDDPHFYGKEEKNEITETSKCSEGFVGKLHKLLGTVGVNSLTVPDDGKCLGGARMDAIRFAAIIRMLPFSPNASNFFPDSVMSVVSQLGEAGWVAGAALYSYGATSVAFPEAPGSEEFRTSLSFERGKPITVRVSYLAHCGIPLARYLMCDSSHRLAIGIGVDEEHVKAAEGLAKGVGSRVLLGGLIASDERFRVLRADATLPLNSASYDYKLKE